MNFFVVLFPIIAAGLLTIFLCHFAMRIATACNLLDIPGDRKKHAHVTPLMGGIVLLAAFVPAALALIATSGSSAQIGKLLIWLLATAAMTIVGILDDRHSLSPRLRLLLSFSIFGIAAYIEPIYNVRVLDFEFPQFGLGLGTRGIAIFFTVLCCVGLVNAVNMADGKNGLVIGLCIGWLALLALRSPPIFLPLIALLMVVLTVLLLYNLNGKLFLGDGGAYGLASAIAVLAIAIYNSPGLHVTRAISADGLVLLFIVPVFDSFRLTYKRLRRGQSPMAGDRDHLHHHLQNELGWPAGLIAYWALALLPFILVAVATTS